ncbi:MAG: tyrosine-type recombinase/integrase [Flavobacterium sp.]|uniref:tyrosine-type recombinase/integrase n=1 Tax=Flavobacterium sp. TaxID=239 RepID=UPI002FCAE330
MDTQNTNPEFNPSLFKITLGTHRGKKVIWLKFNYDKLLIEILRQHTKAHWSQLEKTWYVVDNLHNRNLCGIQPDIVGKDVLCKISASNLPEFQKYQNILTLKSLSPNTIRTYSIEFAQLLYLLKDFPVQELSPERLQSYFLYCFKELKLSENQIHSRINAIKFYYEKVLHRKKMFLDILRPKKPLLLPKSLNIEDVKKLFSVTENIKHRLILQLCYGMGLRVSEIVNLKIEDIDSRNMKVLIHRGKGKKDRYVNLPHSVLEDLRNYYKEYLPKDFLFEGQYGGQYTVRSSQLVFKKAMKKAKINKNIGIHGLRHSYATHLLEFGTDISFIQKLLGHNDIRTTQIYARASDTSIAKVVSPLDRI